MKSVILIAVFFTCANMANAQGFLPELSLRNVSNIRYYVSTNYKANFAFTDTACIHTVVFLKFKVTTDGKIDSLDFSKGAPQELKNGLRMAMLTTNGLWKLSKDELQITGSKTFLLPVIFDYSSGCSTARRDSINVDKNGNVSIVYRNQNANPRYAIKDMLDFDSGRKLTLECVFINPIGFSEME